MFKHIQSVQEMSVWDKNNEPPPKEFWFNAQVLKEWLAARRPSDS